MAKSGYQVVKDKSRLKVRFVFVSKGVLDIIKVIDYDYVGLYHNTKIFNLGFGDYLPNSGKVDDQAIADNGDVYNVLNTVLNTIPLFFEEYPYYTLMVQGSDSGAEFIKRCKPLCKKKCKEHECRNQNRRINVYTKYVNANYNQLIREYTFLGGNEDSVEPFVKGKKYDTVFVSKKKLTLKYENKEHKNR